MGKVAFDVAGLGVGPPCLRVDSEETLLIVIDERAQLARAAPGVTPVDSSEEGAPVWELIQLSVLGEPLVDSLQEPMPAEERLEYAIQATVAIWEPLEQMRYVVSDEVTFDSCLIILEKNSLFFLKNCSVIVFPSKQWTTRPDIAKVGPTPDECSSYVYLE